MISEAQKRSCVSDLYPGPKWKKRVEHMNNVQITAIYLKQNGSKSSEDIVEFTSIPEPESTTQPFLPGRGPHFNEDDFPSY